MVLATGHAAVALAVAVQTFAGTEAARIFATAAVVAREAAKTARKCYKDAHGVWNDAMDKAEEAAKLIPVNEKVKMLMEMGGGSWNLVDVEKALKIAGGDMSLAGSYLANCLLSD